MTTEIDNQDNVPVENQEEKVSEKPAVETKETETPAKTSETADAAKTSETADAAKTSETAPASEKKTEASPARRSGPGGEPRRERPQGEYQRRDSSQRYPKFRRKVCYFCANKGAEIDYKNADTLGRFITDRGKILPRRVTGVCSRHQRGLANAIKKARIIALIPFIEK
jgi:small subunit ribosomal protein S18